MADSTRTIGAMNGPWALSFRIMLASYPFLVASMIGLGTWIVTKIFELKAWQQQSIAQGAITTEGAKILKLEISAERDLAIAAQHAAFDSEMSALRKTNLDIQGELQKQQFQIERMQDRKPAR